MASSETLTWRVDGVVPAAKCAGAAALAALTFAVGRDDPSRWAVAGLVVLALIGWAVRDVLAPVRLAAGPSGVTVPAGLVGRRQVPWARIERIRVDRRERRGLRSELLEIDAGDSLHLFGHRDLGAPPDEVAEALTALRSRL